MTAAALPLDHIEQVEYHLAHARRSWKPSSPEACMACCQHLELAIAEIRRAQQAMTEGIAAAPSKERLQHMQKEIVLLGRLIDASISFYRGLALHTGMEEPAISRIEG